MKAAAGRGFSIRVAIIGGTQDLGAVTELWRQPRTYARFLGYELSLAYKQRLLVVMPDGFGFNWPGHLSAPEYRTLAGVSIGSGATGLFNAAEAAVGKLARVGGVKLPSSATAPPASAASTTVAAGAAGQSPAPRRSADDVLGIVVLALVAFAGMASGVRWMARRRGWARPRFPVGLRVRLPSVAVVIPGGAVLLLVVVAGAVIVVRSNAPARSQAAALAVNPFLDPAPRCRGGCGFHAA